MSLIGLLTATEKQVHLGRLHMRPIQWHLKNNWRVPESLEKVIPIPRSLHPHLEWWQDKRNVLQGLPKEARLSFFVFFLNLTVYTLSTYLQISSRSWFIGESAEQPLQDPSGRALNQPRPHPSDKIV